MNVVAILALQNFKEQRVLGIARFCAWHFFDGCSTALTRFFQALLEIQLPSFTKHFFWRVSNHQPDSLRSSSVTSWLNMVEHRCTEAIGLADDFDSTCRQELFPMNYLPPGTAERAPNPWRSMKWPVRSIIDILCIYIYILECTWIFEIISERMIHVTQSHQSTCQQIRKQTKHKQKGQNYMETMERKHQTTQKTTKTQEAKQEAEPKVFLRSNKASFFDHFTLWNLLGLASWLLQEAASLVSQDRWANNSKTQFQDTVWRGFLTEVERLTYFLIDKLLVWYWMSLMLYGDCFHCFGSSFLILTVFQSFINCGHWLMIDDSNDICIGHIGHRWKKMSQDGGMFSGDAV